MLNLVALPQSAPQVVAHFNPPASPAPPLFREVSDTCDSSPSLPPPVPPKAAPPLKAPPPFPSMGRCHDAANLERNTEVNALAKRFLRESLPPQVAPKEYQPSPPPPLNPKKILD